MKYLIVFTGLFPFFTVKSFGTNIQPWNIIFVVIFFFNYILKKRKIFKLQINFIILLLLVIFLVLLSDNDLFSYTRSLLGYMSIFLTPFVFYLIINKNYILFLKFIKTSTIVYFLVGLIQKFINNNFGSIFLNRISTDSVRGVCSLAPEPTFYGIIGIFYILIIDLIYNNSIDKSLKKYYYLWITQIVFLAQSSMAILFLMIFYFYKILFSLSFKTVLILLFFIYSIGFVLFNIDLTPYSNIRAIELLNTFKESGFEIIMLDESINDRMSAIYFSIKGFLDNFGLPHGMASYANYLLKELPNQTTFYWVSIDNRIMSFYGSILFELGFFGIILILMFNYFILKSNIKKKDKLTYLFFLNTILWSAIPLSFPLIYVFFSLILQKGVFYYENKNIRNTR